MNVERWRQVTGIFHAALARDAGIRDAFLSDACKDDPSLRDEVDALVAAHQDAGSFGAAPVSVDPSTHLSPGTRLGIYLIDGLLGAGGMGEVYRAKDTRLGREVAIKILPELFTLDSDRLARFRREARVLASLNHPNIAALHGFEEATIEATAGGQPGRPRQSLLIMELVKGEDLSQRIARGRLPIAEALEIAAQMAEALEAAHEQGIVHRDLKPANVKVREDGTVKVLDFGLAKALDPVGASAVDEAASPTVTGHATKMGIVIGTAAYMSPEQARGKVVDRRADVWAFGVVLYEMLTGRRAFGGDEISDVLAAVLTETPSMEALPAGTPEPVRRLLRRCLMKDRRERLGDLSAARIEIKDALSSDVLAASSAVSPARRRVEPGTIAAALVLALLAAIGAWVLKPPPATTLPLVTRFQVELPANSTWTRMNQHVIAVSPDGSRVAYVADRRLFVRPLGEFESTMIASVIDPSEISFSPDGQWIGFYASGKLQKVALTGGAAIPVSTVDTPFGATWTDGSIVFGQETGIFRVADTGGTPERLVTAEANEYVAHPSLLRGGEVLLYTRARAGTPSDDAEIVVEVTATHARQVVARGGTDPRYLPTGHLVFCRAGDLLALRFDLATLRASGTPVVLLSGVAHATSPQSGTAQFGFSETGTLAYVAKAQPEARLIWLDLQGREQAISSEVSDYLFPRLSPKDGSRLLFNQGLGRGNLDIFIRDMARQTTTQLTTHAAIDTAPIWTPDGTRVIYASNRDGAAINIYWQPADGTGTVERLTSSPNTQQPYAVTPDGKTLIYPEAAAGQFDIYAMALTGDRTPRALLKTHFNERRPAISPDGHWVAYQSDETGEYEIVVRPFPEVDRERYLVSVGGGANPIWSPVGAEIFYQQGASLVRVSVTTTPRFSVGQPQVIGSEVLSSYSEAGIRYSIAPDGQRFVIAKPVDSSSLTSKYRVVLNWFEDVKARTRAPE